MTALLAGAMLQTSVELAEARNEILLDVVQHEPVLVQQVVARFAIPLQPIQHFAIIALHFDHQSYGARAATRLVWRARGQEEHFSLLDRYPHRLTVLLYAYFDIALQLVEKLLGLV